MYSKLEFFETSESELLIQWVAKNWHSILRSFFRKSAFIWQCQFLATHWTCKVDSQNATENRKRCFFFIEKPEKAVFFLYEVGAESRSCSRTYSLFQKLFFGKTSLLEVFESLLAGS